MVSIGLGSTLRDGADGHSQAGWVLVVVVIYRSLAEIEMLSRSFPQESRRRRTLVDI